MPDWREWIDFSETMPQTPKARAHAIRERFGISTGRFWWELHRAIDRPEALKYKPMTVGHLLRARENGRMRRGTRGDAA